ncbi:MAG: transcription-repair coupling factor [Planctomycetes bacterium]|nr:transcription-repair coupling factor [Planctomycetota bacterium]
MKAGPKTLPQLLAKQAAFGDLVSALGDQGAATAEGLWGSSARALAAACLERRPAPVALYCLAHINDAEDVRDELAAFTDWTVEVFPAWETLPRESDVGDDILAGRLRILKQLKTLRAAMGEAHEGPPLVLVAPIQALLQPVPSPRHLDDNTIILRVGDDYDPEKLRAWLVERGFEPADLISSRGEFSMRGGILDVYPPAAAMPYRIEFFGDSVESIRTFDTSTQRSVGEVREVAITFLPQGQIKPTATCNLLNYLPEGSLTVWQDPLEVAEMGRSFVARLSSPVGIYEYDGLVRQRASFPRLDLWSFAASADDLARFTFRVETVQRFSGKVDRVKDELTQLADENRIWIFCENQGERERLDELIRDMPAPLQGNLQTCIGPLTEGFRLVDAAMLVVGNHELFQRYKVRRPVSRQLESRPIDSFLELKQGDYVVHLVHGIGRYLGIETLKQEGKVEDFLAIEYRDGAKMYVPASHVHLVQKYIGGFKGNVVLSKLGGKSWADRKERVAEAVQDLALELLETEAARSSQNGFRFPADTLWMREMETSFPYQETDDQLAAMEEIKRDMQSGQAMDRLVCGDVGYGKTELAVRAVFKAAEAGKQSAVLVPTTILAEQHYRTFGERLADYPVTVEMLSRFLTKGQQNEVLDRVRKGQVDVIVGTHRLLSKDVQFADLGLVVIDEEQRFGVEHKERLKRFRRTVDVLTLTATPIPRTLHMSLLGIRDISSLSTPPQDRRAIRTEVCRWDDQLIRQSIIRELNRDGQIFFVHNRIYNIQAITAQLAALVPEARIVWAHGQMPEHELEERMHEFLERRADILVSTTIIESGLDIPTANTMFINMADLFGLAELHQLRGRIGRYKHRGYCYLLLPRDRPIRPEAVKRLKAIEEFSELGSGFQIAMRDLEIRGAGNILGAEQSGHIAAVGYELFCRLLEDAIRRAKGMEVEDQFEAIVEVGVSAFLPKDYAPSDRQRMTVYRMISRAKTIDLLQEVRQDVVDMLGKLPPPAEFLFDLQEIRIHACRWRISNIKSAVNDVVFTIENLQSVGPLFTDAPGKVRVVNERTIYLRLRPESMDPLRLVIILKQLLGKPSQ